MSNFKNDLKSLNFVLKNGGIENASEYIEQLMIKYPDSDILLLKKAGLAHRVSEVEEAKEIYLDVISRNSSATKIFAMRDLFIIYIEQNLIDEATELFKQIEDSQIDRKLYLFLKSMLLRRQGEYIEASNLLIEATRKANNEEDTHLLDLCIEEIFKNYTDYFKRNNYSLIKKTIQKIYSKVNGKSKARMNIHLANLEQTKANFQEALNLYRTALSYKHNWIKGNAIIGICKIYLMMGNPDLLNSVEFEELKTFDFQEAYYLTIQIYASYNQIDKALELIEQQPQNVKMMFEKAKIYIKCGRHDEALELFKQCFNKSNNMLIYKASSLFGMINIYLHFNKFDQALEIFMNNKKILKEINENLYCQIYAYLCSKLGLVYEENCYSYSVNQILNYDIDKANKHIKKHINEFDEILDFDGDLEKFLSDLQSKLSAKIYLDSSFFDIYKVKYPGKNGAIYITAIALPNTKNIITCFHSSKIELMLNEMDEIVEEPSKQKVIQRKSQIEKFNEKYNR